MSWKKIVLIESENLFPTDNTPYRLTHRSVSQATGGVWHKPGLKSLSIKKDVYIICFCTEAFTVKPECQSESSSVYKQKTLQKKWYQYTPLPTSAHKMHNNTFASKSTQHSKFQRSLRCIIQTVTVQKNKQKNKTVEIYSSLVPCSNQRLGESLSQFKSHWYLSWVSFTAVCVPKKLRPHLLYTGQEEAAGYRYRGSGLWITIEMDEERWAAEQTTDCFCALPGFGRRAAENLSSFCVFRVSFSQLECVCVCVEVCPQRSRSPQYSNKNFCDYMQTTTTCVSVWSVCKAQCTILFFSKLILNNLHYQRWQMPELFTFNGNGSETDSTCIISVISVRF